MMDGNEGDFDSQNVEEEVALKLVDYDLDDKNTDLASLEPKPTYEELMNEVDKLREENRALIQDCDQLKIAATNLSNQISPYAHIITGRHKIFEPLQKYEIAAWKRNPNDFPELNPEVRKKEEKIAKWYEAEISLRKRALSFLLTDHHTRYKGPYLGKRVRDKIRQEILENLKHRKMPGREVPEPIRENKVLIFRVNRKNTQTALPIKGVRGNLLMIQDDLEADDDQPQMGMNEELRSTNHRKRTYTEITASVRSERNTQSDSSDDFIEPINRIRGKAQVKQETSSKTLKGRGRGGGQRSVGSRAKGGGERRSQAQVRKKGGSRGRGRDRGGSRGSTSTRGRQRMQTNNSHDDEPLMNSFGIAPDQEDPNDSIRQQGFTLSEEHLNENRRRKRAKTSVFPRPKKIDDMAMVLSKVDFGFLRPGGSHENIEEEGGQMNRQFRNSRLSTLASTISSLQRSTHRKSRNKVSGFDSPMRCEVGEDFELPESFIRDLKKQRPVDSQEIDDKLENEEAVERIDIEVDGKDEKGEMRDGGHRDDQSHE